MSDFFSDRLRELRGNRNKAEFARFLGIPAPMYHRYELGQVPKEDNLRVISKRCQVTVDWLLGLEDGEKKGADALTSTPATCSDCVAKDLEIARLRGALEQSRHHEAALLSALGSKKEVPPAVPASGAVAGRARTGA